MPIIPIILSFFAGPVGKWIGIAIGGLILVAILVGIYKLHNDAIRREALAVYNRNQLEQIVIDQKRFIAELNRLQDLQKITIEDLQKQTDILTTKLGVVDTYLSSQEAKAADKPSSDVLKNTIKYLESVK